jgi:hypothetical protein
MHTSAAKDMCVIAWDVVHDQQMLGLGFVPICVAFLQYFIPKQVLTFEKGSSHDIVRWIL